MQHENRPLSPARVGLAKKLAAMALIGGVTGAAALLGARVSKPGLWYRRLRKPAGTPPPALFGPVWTVLYTAMAVSAFRVWRNQNATGRRKALALWGLQLGLNAAWSPVFFGAHKPRAALGVITAMLPAIATYAWTARRVDRWAGRLMLPYMGWTGYATYLNAGIARNN